MSWGGRTLPVDSAKLTGMGVGVPPGEGVSFKRRGAVYIVFHRTSRALTRINRFLGGPWSQEGSSRRPPVRALEFYRALGSTVPHLANFHRNCSLITRSRYPRRKLTTNT